MADLMEAILRGIDQILFFVQSLKFKFSIRDLPMAITSPETPALVWITTFIR